jgi:thymidylate kinase
VRNAYLDRARQEPKRFAVIDATQSLEAVTLAIQQAIAERLQKLAAP